MIAEYRDPKNTKIPNFTMIFSENIEAIIMTMQKKAIAVKKNWLLVKKFFILFIEYILYDNYLKRVYCFETQTKKKL